MAERRRRARRGSSDDSSQTSEEDAAHRARVKRTKRTPNQSSLLCKMFLLTIAGLAFFAWAYPSPIQPVSFSYSNDSSPEMVGPLAINDHLKRGKRIFENKILAPEALVMDKNGDIYSGLADGHIIKIDKDLKAFTIILRTGSDSEKCGEKKSAAVEEMCGRPLGMVINSRNEDELYVADSSIGLLRVNLKTKSVEILISKNTSSVRINLLNDIVQLPNGSFLITDSSLKFSRHDNMLDVLESSASGQLILYEPDDGSVRVVLPRLYFPNGLCLHRDGESVMIVETTRARILRYYFSGKKAGQVEIFAGNLIGLPDNLSPSASGGYWVGIAGIRTPFANFLANNMVSVRSLLAKFHLVPLLKMTGVIIEHGLVLEMDKDGRVVRSLHDEGGHTGSTTSHILEIDDSLLIGSYLAPYLIRVKL